MKINSLRIMTLCVILITLISCKSKPQTGTTGGNNNVVEKENTPEIIYNDSIQDTFFGVKFGTEKRELIRKFESHNLVYDKYLSDDTTLRFRSRSGRKFNFGGLSWEMLNVCLSNNRFYFIQFMNAFKDKAAAINEYDGLLSTVSSKYEMMEEAPKDSTEYKISRGYSKKDPHHYVVTSVFRYESYRGVIFNGVTLDYFDEDYQSSVSDEL